MGQQGQHKPRSHASMAMVQRLSYNSASVCASPAGAAAASWCDSRTTLRLLVSYRPLARF